MPQEDQYPWNILEIEATDDKKLIKKAYAVLIKQYKPDEHPEKFQEIQEAYKYALKLSKLTDENNDSHPRKRNHYNSDNDIVPSDNQEELILNNILDEIKSLLDRNLTTINKVESWDFIDMDKEVYNISYKYQMSATVFKIIAEYNLSQNKTISLIDVDILSKLRKHYHWDEYWKQFNKEFPPQFLKINLFTLELKDTIKNLENNTYARVISTFLDFLLPVILTTIIKKVSVIAFNIQISEQTLMHSMLFLFFTIRVLMEIYHPLHRSLGKFPCNLFILTTEGKFCSKKRILVRNILVTLMLTPLIIAATASEIIAFLNYSTFAVIVVINYLTDIFEGGFIHDLITKTRVVKL